VAGFSLFQLLFRLVPKHVYSTLRLSGLLQQLVGAGAYRIEVSLRHGQSPDLKLGVSGVAHEGHRAVARLRSNLTPNKEFQARACDGPLDSGPWQINDYCAAVHSGIELGQSDVHGFARCAKRFQALLRLKAEAGTGALLLRPPIGLFGPRYSRRLGSQPINYARLSANNNAVLHSTPRSQCSPDLSLRAATINIADHNLQSYLGNVAIVATFSQCPSPEGILPAPARNPPAPRAGAIFVLRNYTGQFTNVLFCCPGIDKDHLGSWGRTVMDRVEYAFAVTTLTGFWVLIAGLSWLLL
jgi:hypothetical protein